MSEENVFAEALEDESRSENEREEIPPPPLEGTVPAVVFTQQHAQIGDELLSRVRGMITHLKYKVDNYSLSLAKGSWDTDDESMALVFEDGRKLTIMVQSKKKE